MHGPLNVKLKLASERLLRVPLNYLKSYAFGRTDKWACSCSFTETYTAMVTVRYTRGDNLSGAVATGRATFPKSIQWPGFRARLSGLSTSNRSLSVPKPQSRFVEQEMYWDLTCFGTDPNGPELHYEIALPTPRMYQNRRKCVRSAYFFCVCL
jgi:hypothetical protein